MSEPNHMFSGRCHCAAISMELAFTCTAQEMQVRSCQCDFCRRQGSLIVSQASGRAVITVTADQLTSYSFGSQTASFLICRRCGVYAGAVMADGDKLVSIANARGLGIEASRHSRSASACTRHMTMRRRRRASSAACKDGRRPRSITKNYVRVAKESLSAEGGFSK
jgi:hypothetical protein